VAEVRRKTRSIWQWVALIAFVLLATPLGVAALLRTPAAREYIRQQAVLAIRSELGLVGLIADVDVEPRTLSVIARGIVLDHPQHGRFVEAELLRIRPSWWAMLRGKLDLHVITIDRARVWLTLQDGALINGPRVQPSKGGGMSVDLPFNKLWVKRSRLVVRAAPGGSAELHDIELFLDSTSEDVLGVQLHTSGGVIQHERGRDEIRELTARFKLTEDNVQVELLRLQSQDLALNVRRGGFELPWRNSYHGEVDLRLALGRLHAWPLPFELPPLAGDLNVHAELVGDAEGPRGEAKIELTRGVVDDYGVGEYVVFDVDLDPRELRFKGQLEQVRNAGRVELVGALRLEDKLPFSVRARVVDVAFDRLMKQLSVSPDAIVGWTLAGNFELKGTLDPLLLTGPLRMPTRDFRVTRDAWHVTPQRNVIAVASANLVGSVRVDPTGITLHDIDVGMRRSKLAVSEVLLGFENQVRVRASGILLDLADVTPLVDFPIAGKGSFDVRVDGIFRDPSVSGELHFVDFAFGTFPFGDVESEFVLEKDHMAVRFPELLGKKQNSRYRARDFVLDFSDKRLAINAALTLDRFAMQEFYHVFHYEQDERYLPYQALVNGAVQLRYTLGYPGDTLRGTLQADMDLDLLEAELGGFAFHSGHFDGRFSWFDHAQGYRSVELGVERFALHKADTTVSISGKMAREGKLDMVVVADRLSVRDTEGLAERMPELSGEYSATGTIKGNLAMPRADLELASVGLTYKGEPTGAARAYLRLTGKEDPWVKASLDWPEHAPPSDAPCGHAREGLARGSWPEDPPLRTAQGYVPALDSPMAYLICGEAFGGKLAIDLAVGRTSAYPLRGQLEFRGLEFGRLLAPGRKDAPVAKLSGLLQLHGGAMLTPSSLSGLIALDAVEIGQLGVTLQNQGPIRASFSRGQFEIDSATLTGPAASTLTIAGGASLQSGLALELTGAIDLGILPSFTPLLEKASGRVSADFKITGRLDRPSVFGQARLVNGGMQLHGMPFPIEKADALATISAQRLLLEQFSANVLGGNVHMQGVATLDGSSIDGVRLDVQGQRVAFTPRDGVDLVVGGQGALSWKHGDRLPKLTGTLRLDRAAYRRPITVGRTLRDMTKTERTDVDSYDPSADRLELDLRVVQAEPLRVENNLIEAEISIDDSKDAFRLVGTDQRFGVLGQMSIRRGTVRLRDTAFAIKQGEITFDDAHRVEPSFDVHAETDVRRSAEFGQTSWHIGAHAWGTPESFQFTLLSDPYLSQEDISLLLAVGMTQTELAALRTSDVTGTAALEALATVAGVDSEVQRALPAIDEVRIGSAYSQRSQRTEPQLHLGKRIADRVRLDASTGLSESRDFSTSLEYQISDETSVGAAYNNQIVSTTSPVGDVGVDLKWRLEFD
jgi:translocation and assembly module TamB